MNQETLPNSQVIEKMILEIVLPALETISKDIGRLLEFEIVVMQEASEVSKLGKLSVGKRQMPLICGNVRLRFREVSKNCLLMHCEALFDREQAVSNCSGFSIKAAFQENISKRKAWAIRYGVWDWMGWN